MECIIYFRISGHIIMCFVSAAATFVLDQAMYTVGEAEGPLPVLVRVDNSVVLETDIQIEVRKSSGTAIGNSLALLNYSH